MANYNEYYISVTLNENTPKSLIERLKEASKGEMCNPKLVDDTSFVRYIGRMSCYYTNSRTAARQMFFDEISGLYSFIFKGDVSDRELGDFYDFVSDIAPWVKGEFIGYVMSEFDKTPDIITKSETLYEEEI